MSQEVPPPMEQIPILASLAADDRYKTLVTFIREKMEAAAVLFYVFSGLIFPVICVLFGIFCLFSPFLPVAILYGLWFYHDFKTPERGSRERPGIRDSFIWQLIANYFPIKIVKTGDLPRNNNYIIGCHPHGIGCFGAFISLCTNANGFTRYFPGIHSTIATLKGMFYFPLRREQLLALGLIAASEESLDYYLNTGSGKAVGIVIGGTEEVVKPHSGRHDLTLKNRRNFIRVAFRHGAHLVPMYCFGESELYSQVPNESGIFVRRIQEFVKRFIHWSPTLLYGNLCCGILPKRKQIHCVFGHAIPIMKNTDPSEEDINRIYEQYCTELENIFNQFKNHFGFGEEELHFK